MEESVYLCCEYLFTLPEITGSYIQFLSMQRRSDLAFFTMPGAEHCNIKLHCRYLWGPFLTSPLAPRGKLHSRVEFVPQGWTLSPRGNVPPFVHPKGWTLSTAWKNGGANIQILPQGITSPLGDKIHPWGQSLPLGAKLRMGIWHPVL
jgi:hypothetical protein